MSMRESEASSVGATVRISIHVVAAAENNRDTH